MVHNYDISKAKTKVPQNQIAAFFARVDSSLPCEEIDVNIICSLYLAGLITEEQFCDEALTWGSLPDDAREYAINVLLAAGEREGQLNADRLR